ncbi:uncharacterized protein LOC105701553 isoform X2 [Orussus abietinus]|nr:uncharacterized protein LOC105701553 isoform X2 [Orussus abietinus]XP_023287963.1 uncharacterized protein LOC105701553 isoform X2 [Orussus abietinus]XP_023287964.1 uncharacterized protein LOC105701553 isoform X2 [Orussus abietinus]
MDSTVSTDPLKSGVNSEQTGIITECDSEAMTMPAIYVQNTASKHEQIPKNKSNTKNSPDSKQHTEQSDKCIRKRKDFNNYVISIPCVKKSPTNSVRKTNPSRAKQSIVSNESINCNTEGKSGLQDIGVIEDKPRKKRKIAGCDIVEQHVEANTKLVSKESIEAEEEKIKSIPMNDKEESHETNNLNNSVILSETPVRRKRGRPRKNPPSVTTQISDALQEESNIHLTESIEGAVNLDDCNNLASASGSTPCRTRIAKIRQDTTDGKGLSEESDSEDFSECVIPTKRKGRKRYRGRGRGRGKGRGKCFRDSEYIPRQLKSQANSKSLNGEEELLNEEVLNVKCIRCEKEVPTNKWHMHNLQEHNYMGWHEGEEVMDLENDEKLLKRVLTYAIKQKRGRLTCEKCKEVKRSVIGFISHMQFCGKTADESMAMMIPCSICHHLMKPSSKDMHMRIHRQAEQKLLLPVEDLDAATPRRKAAEKAIAKISEFTVMTKDENEQPSKKTHTDSKQFIQKPLLIKRIPGILKALWKKQIIENGVAACRQAGCQFTAPSVEEICKHYSLCNFTPQQDFVCKICNYSTEDEANITQHVKENHPSDEFINKGLNSDNEGKYATSSEDSDSDSTEMDSTISKMRVCRESSRSHRRIDFLDKEIVQKSICSKPYAAALNLTLKFALKNYQLSLYNEYVPNTFTLLSNSEARMYLPELENSMQTATMEPQNLENLKDETIQWKTWTLAEGGFDNGVPTLFVGGPVWALAWLPIPTPMYKKQPTQYLAVSTHPTMESSYAVGKSYSGRNAIQIWSLGHLDHEDAMTAPSLAYAVAHHHGTIWTLEWCPSGCYEDESLLNYCKTNNKLRRMGLLAAACSDGCVHIYSLPFPEELRPPEETNPRWLVYKAEPVLTLVVNIILHDNAKELWQCTKLSWSKERGHNTIVAGFSNGYVALWDLTNKSPLLLNKRGNTTTLSACRHFCAHGHAVSMVSLVPYGNKRYLVTASYDRCYKFWDLENTSYPQSTTRKGLIVDGTWMLHWPCGLVSFDDAFGLGHTNSYIVPLREYGYKIFPILGTNSPTYTISMCDYANGIAHGTLAGEVITIFPHQLLYINDMDKTLTKKRRVSSYVHVMDFDPKTCSEVANAQNSDKAEEKNDESCDYHYMPDKYVDCKDRFGLVFCDSVKSITKKIDTSKPTKSLVAENLKNIPVEQYPFMSVNRILWNPNSWSYLWLATGYHCGIVRLLTFRSMTNPEQKKLLPQYAQKMIAQAAVASNN